MTTSCKAQRRTSPVGSRGVASAPDGDARFSRSPTTDHRPPTPVFGSRVRSPSRLGGDRVPWRAQSDLRALSGSGGRPSVGAEDGRSLGSDGASRSPTPDHRPPSTDIRFRLASTLALPVRRRSCAMESAKRSPCLVGIRRATLRGSRKRAVVGLGRSLALLATDHRPPSTDIRFRLGRSLTLLTTDH